MNNLAVAERFFNETARIEKIIYIAGNDFDAGADDLREFIEGIDSAELIERCFGKPSQRLLAALEDGIEFYSEFSDWLLSMEKLGFLVQFATPVMTPFKNCGGAYFSWDYYNIQWVYGDTFEEAVERGFQWVEECRGEEKAQPAPSQGEDA